MEPSSIPFASSAKSRPQKLGAAHHEILDSSFRLKAAVALDSSCVMASSPGPLPFAVVFSSPTTSGPVSVRDGSQHAQLSCLAPIGPWKTSHLQRPISGDGERNIRSCKTRHGSCWIPPPERNSEAGLLPTRFEHFTGMSRKMHSRNFACNQENILGRGQICRQNCHFHPS